MQSLVVECMQGSVEKSTKQDASPRFYPQRLGGQHTERPSCQKSATSCLELGQGMRVVVKIMVPFWVPIIIRHLISRAPKKES